MIRVHLSVALLLLSLTAWADEASYSISGGGFGASSSDLTVSGTAIASPPGTLSMDCLVTGVFTGTYAITYDCSGGTLSLQSSDGLTSFSGAVTSGVATYTCSGGGKGGNVSCAYAFSGTLAGTLTLSGRAQAVSGGMSFSVGATGKLFPLGGSIQLGSVYSPVYVADTYNNRIVRMDSMSGAGWTMLGTTGGGVKQFSNPLGIGLDASGRIYVADTGNCRIVRMDDLTGKNWTTLGTCGSGTSQFNTPSGVAVDAAGKIYVADSGNNRIARVDDMTGANWIAFGQAGSGMNQFNGPRGVIFDAGNRIYIADTNNDRVVRVDDLTGTNWTTLSGTGAGLFESVTAIGLDPAGRIYIMDEYAAQVVREDDMTGANRTAVGTFSGGVGGFINPYGLSVNPLDGTIFVADTQDGRIVRMGDMSTMNWSSYGSYGPAVGQFGGPNGLVAVPVATPVPALTLSSNTLSFGNQNVGTTSAPQSVTVTNFGGAPLVVQSATALGDFTQTNNCAGLAGGSNCTVSIAYAPSTTGPEKGAFVMTDNAGAGKQGILLSGTGTTPIPGIAPYGLTFPAQAVNTASASQIVILSNTGTGPLTINSISASGDFAQTDNCAGSLAAASSCTINVTFTPTATGTRSGSLVVASTQSIPAVSLTGTGASATPTVAASPASLMFPAELVGSTSASQTVTLSNQGTTALSISAITTSGDFGETDTCGNYLLAGKSCKASITFTPTAAGIRSGSLTFKLSTGTQTVELTGTATTSGAPPSLTVAPTALNFGAVPVGDQSVLTISVTNTNGVDAGIASVAVAGSPEFQDNNRCGRVLAAGTSCTIYVQLTPRTTPTSYSGNLVVTESSGAVHTIPLSGNN